MDLLGGLTGKFVAPKIRGLSSVAKQDALAGELPKAETAQGSAEGAALPKAEAVKGANEGSASATEGPGLETKGYRPAPGERTIQGQVDAAVEQAGGNPTIQRGGQDLFRLRSNGHGSTGATATPQNIRNVAPNGRSFLQKGDDIPVGPREIRELYKAQTNQGTSKIRTKSGK